MSNMKGQSEVEWYSVECYCPCIKVKGNHCIQCEHLQKPNTYTIIHPSQKIPQQKAFPEMDPEKALDSLARAYVKKHIH